MSKKLLYCPFCNGKANVKDMRGFTYFVECKECKASTGMFVDKNEAVDAWNRRDGIHEK